MNLSRLLAFFFPVTCVACGSDLPPDDTFRVCAPCRDSVKRIEGLVCVQCGKPLDSGGAHCYFCRKGARFHFLAARSAACYEGVIKKLIHSFKYAHRDYLGRYLGAILADCVKKQSSFADIDMIVPVPLHWSKKWMRGYNQAELLARQVAAELDTPLYPDVLVRRRRGKVQAALDRRSRFKNMRELMVVRDAPPVGGRKILLIDDVATTCATLESCAAALRRAGALKVVCATVARD